MKNRLEIEDWGIELELANIPILEKEEFFNKLNFTVNRKEKTIINNDNGIYFFNDPSYRNYDIGGEINSNPMSEDMLLEKLELLFNDIPQKAFDDGHFNLHIHIKIKDFDKEKALSLFRTISQHYGSIEETLNLLKYKATKFVNNRFNKTYVDKIIDTLERAESLKDWENWYFLKSQATPSMYTKNQLNFMKGTYMRPWINLSQIFQTNTIEFRCFDLNEASIDQIKEFFKFIKYLITISNLETIAKFDNSKILPNGRVLIDKKTVLSVKQYKERL